MIFDFQDTIQNPLQLRKECDLRKEQCSCSWLRTVLWHKLSRLGDNNIAFPVDCVVEIFSDMIVIGHGSINCAIYTTMTAPILSKRFTSCPTSAYLIERRFYRIQIVHLFQYFCNYVFVSRNKSSKHGVVRDVLFVMHLSYFCRQSSIGPHYRQLLTLENKNNILDTFTSG